MSSSRIFAAAVGAAAAVLAVGACSNNATPQSTPTSASAATSSVAAEAHNQADVMFAQMMIPHHQQAVEMSDMVLAKQGIDPRVVDLAKQIKAAQAPEIEQMKGWLTQWGAPAMSMPSSMPMPGMMPGMSPSSTNPGDDGAPHHGAMPGMTGMMSDQDMSALQNAQGVAAGKLFLTQMIAHHQGAISMADTEITSGQFPATITLAQNIKTTQQQEIDTMKALLGTL